MARHYLTLLVMQTDRRKRDLSSGAYNNASYKLVKQYRG